MKRLDQKRCLITGTASGIGRATVLRFLEEGARVIAVDRPGSDLSGLGDAVVIEQDVTAPDAADTLAALCTKHLGGLDVLINNAGVGFSAKPTETTDALWDTSFAVNTHAPFRITRACIPLLAQSKAGRIINTGSVMSERTDKGLTAYTASKHAIAGMTKALALELGPMGITANYVMPGAVLTALTKASFDDEKIRAIWEKKSPLRRIADPREVAHVMLFLASDESSFITGTGLTVDGGLTLRT